MAHTPLRFRVALERAPDGTVAAWCLDLPGAVATSPPGVDPLVRARIAISEFASWSHNRQAERVDIALEHLETAQLLESGANVGIGETTAFFLFDAEPASQREYPVWADAHDLAHDELRKLVQTLPPALLEPGLSTTGRTVRELVEHCAASELQFARTLVPATKMTFSGDLLKDLQHAHVALQGVVCDVAPAHVAESLGTDGHMERWSPRKVMRRSVWHLRYHTWEIRRMVGSLWLGE